MLDALLFFYFSPFRVSFGKLCKIRLFEHFSPKARKSADFSRASLFAEQSIASLPKKHCFAQKEALLGSCGVCFLYKTKQKSVLNFLFLSICLNISRLDEKTGVGIILCGGSKKNPPTEIVDGL